MPSQNCMKQVLPEIHNYVFLVLRMLKIVMWPNWPWDLTFWPWRWLWIMKIIQEMNCPVKSTRKWGITFVPSFICWKIIFNLEISGGHFIFDLWNDLSTLKMTLDQQNNTCLGKLRQKKPMMWGLGWSIRWRLTTHTTRPIDLHVLWPIRSGLPALLKWGNVNNPIYHFNHPSALFRYTK